MSTTVRAYAAHDDSGTLHPFEYEWGPLGPEEVEIDIHYCGICHSDLSMARDEWGLTGYPIVPGHEVVGKVADLGSIAQNKGLGINETVGLGWFSSSCMYCRSCLSGHHHLCDSREMTIVGRHGGFAEKIRCHWTWALPLPDHLSPQHAGPLFCGGITVFNPILRCEVKPTERVGVIGIGGLGHLAIQFLNKWGCEVTAFTSNPEKRDEAFRLGAHHVVSSTDDQALADIAGSLHFLINTTNVSLNWSAYLNTLTPKGRFHNVGAVLDPFQIQVFDLMLFDRSFTATPVGSPYANLQMLDFCARHQIEPQIETYPMSRVNEAMEYLAAGKARYRLVLENDF